MRKALSIAAALITLFLIGSRAWGRTPLRLGFPCWQSVAVGSPSSSLEAGIPAPASGNPCDGSLKPVLVPGEECPSAELRAQLDRLYFRRTAGYVIAIPSLAWAGYWVASGLLGYLSGGTHDDYSALKLMIGAPGVVMGLVGLHLIRSAQERIDSIKSQGLKENLSLGFAFDSDKRLYAFSISCTF